MKFRYKLGQTLGDDIITHGDFPAGTAEWDFTGGWSLPVLGGQADHAGATYDYLTQDCGFVAGTRYKITFTISNRGANAYVQLYISGFSITSNPKNKYYVNADGTYTVYGTCLSSTDSNIRFIGYGTISITDVIAEPYEYNAALNYEPGNWENTSISLQKSELIDNLFVKYIDGLTFIKDGYDYLLAEYNSYAALSPKEFCISIPVLIERLEYGTWKTHFEGLIFLSDIKFNLSRKEATCNIEDITASQSIRMAKDKNITITYQNRNVYKAGADKFDYPSTLCGVRYLTGASSTDRYVYFVFKVLRQILHEITDLAVTFESDLLTEANYESIANVYQYLGITAFKNFADQTPLNTYALGVSLDEILRDMNNSINIATLADYTNNIPKLKVESKLQLIGTSYTFSVDNNNCEFTFYKDNNYNAVEIGNDRPDESDVTNTLPGFRMTDLWQTKVFNSELLCNDEMISKILNIAVEPKWIGWQLAYAEYDPVTGAGLPAAFTPRMFFLQMEYSAPNYLSRYAAYTHPSIIGSQDFNNPDFETSKMMQRWVTTLNSSFTYVDYNEAVVTLIKTNDPLIREWEFSTPISLDDLKEIIANPYYMIPMTSEHFTGTISGYILDFKASNKMASEGMTMATFKILST